MVDRPFRLVASYQGGTLGWPLDSLQGKLDRMYGNTGYPKAPRKVEGKFGRLNLHQLLPCSYETKFMYNYQNIGLTNKSKNCETILVEYARFWHTCSCTNEALGWNVVDHIIYMLLGATRFRKRRSFCFLESSLNLFLSSHFYGDLI